MAAVDGIHVAIPPLTSYTYEWGTSLASPRAVGVVAQYLAANQTFAPHRELAKWWLYDWSSKNTVSGLHFTDNNRLLYSYAPLAVARNAASYAEGTARDSLAVGTASFLQTPNQVRFYDSSDALVGGATPSFANTGQVNFPILAGLNNNQTYAVKMYNNDTMVGSGAIRINPVAPGLFSHDSDGNGIASGYLLRVRKSNPTEQILDLLTTSGNGWDSNEFDAYLVIYGTGFRGNNGQVFVQLKDNDGSTIYTLPVLWAGAQGYWMGLDQLNAGPIPPAAKDGGTWDIKFYVNGFPNPPGLLANIVQAKLLGP